MTVRTLFAAALFGIAALAGGVALAQTAVPPGVPAPATQGAPASGEAADRTLVESSCSSCHTLDQVVVQHQDAAEWQATVERMVGYGATPSAEDSDRIVRYLAAHYGKERAATAAPAS